MSEATFARPDLTAFARLDELGLEVVGQRVEPDRAELAYRVVSTPISGVTGAGARVPLGTR